MIPAFYLGACRPGTSLYAFWREVTRLHVTRRLAGLSREAS